MSSQQIFEHVRRLAVGDCDVVGRPIQAADPLSAGPAGLKSRLRAKLRAPQGTSRLLLILFFLAPMLQAQPVLTPTPAQVGPARGTNVEDYNITDSVEIGYRFAEVVGNQGEYRSQQNFGNGVRLLGTSLTMNSKDGHGRYFDEIVLQTIGLGNDPYESARLRIQKNKLYDYNMLWRLNDYYNPALNVAFGYHFMNTRRQLQDHDLTLLPQSKLQFHFGYANNNQSGPALSSYQTFDTRSGIFPLFANVRRSFNEYRVGADINLAGFKLTLLHRWEYSKDDTGYRLDGSTTNPFDATVLSGFTRAEPIHGRSPSWLGNLVANKKWWAVNGRFVYTDGNQGFIQNDFSNGLDRIGNGVNRQVLIEGEAHRPFSTGDLTLSLFPGDRLTLVNTTSFYNQRIDGNSSYLQFDLATKTAQVVSFQLLGVRTIANATDLHYKASKWLSVYAGYHYSDRRIQTIAGFADPGSPPDQTFMQQENHQNVGAFGFRLKPIKPVTINVDAEIGRMNQAYTPITLKDYHTITARAQYKVSKLVLSGVYRELYNNNSVTLTTYSSRSRDYSGNLAWIPRDRFSVDVSYSKIHLDTVGGINFFAAVPRVSLVSGLDSIYVSNVHSATLGSRFVVSKRVDLYAGYSITRDTGDGRGTAVPAGTTNAASLVLLPVQTFPLSFQSPMARVSVKITPKVRWNAGWQLYNYHEDFALFGTYQNYHANTGYTSVLWSF
jgi:hypothetical protein